MCERALLGYFFEAVSLYHALLYGSILGPFRCVGILDVCSLYARVKVRPSDAHPVKERSTSEVSSSDEDGGR